MSKGGWKEGLSLNHVTVFNFHTVYVRGVKLKK